MREDPNRRRQRAGLDWIRRRRVMSYVRGMPMIRSLTADLGDEALTERVLATIADQYAARQRSDGVWVRAAAWLVTAHRS
jgi:hypothetical protein